MPTAAAQSTAGLVQPASTPSISANTMPVNARVESATPGRSSGGAPGRRDSGGQSGPSGAATSTNGTARFSAAIRGKHPVLLRTASVGDRSPAVDDDRLARNRVGGKERQDDLRDVGRL